MHRTVLQTASLTFAVLLCVVVLPSVSSESFENSFYKIDPFPIEKRMRIEAFEHTLLSIQNKDSRPMQVIFQELEGNLSNFFLIQPSSLVIDAGTTRVVNVTLLADTLGKVEGNLTIVGTHTIIIPFALDLTDSAATAVKSIRTDLELITPKALIGKDFSFKVSLDNFVSGDSLSLDVRTQIIPFVNETDETPTIPVWQTTEPVTINSTWSTIYSVALNDSITPGEYILNVTLSNADGKASTSQLIEIRFSFFQATLFGGLKVWMLFVGTGFILVLGSLWYWIYRRAQGKKRYKADVDFSQMPKPGPRVVRLGVFAETTKPMYYEIEQLKTHTLIAGSTGGGKTVSAEVIVEEALLQGSAVVVFDPTAQWSGFLRKNTNKKMFLLYDHFGIKRTEARAFNGNVRELNNPREYVDVIKYMKPGEITVFTLTRLDPKDVDIVVANTIRAIFKANLDEHPLLRLVVVFDEVHRLLPKFGGSGAGFTQIERGAREFRKWGVGLILISQVLSDFAGEIKANITTEVQMRTRDSSDLDRIKTKYGDYMLQSLVKSATGVGMMQNSAYNRGNPFFVWFRPLFHEHARLTNEELANYSKYNDVLDQIEWELEQLEKEHKQDIFDLKLEFKMALDKVKGGNFNMVDIYLEGLRPRVGDVWKKIGKEPKPIKKLLVSEEEIQRDIQKAKEARQSFEAGKAGAAAAAAPKEESVQWKMLRLKNGLVAVNPIELADALAAMSDVDFKNEVNDKENTFADWIATNSKPWADKLRAVGQDKTKVVKILEEGAPQKGSDEKEEKKEEKK